MEEKMLELEEKYLCKLKNIYENPEDNHSYYFYQRKIRSINKKLRKIKAIKKRKNKNEKIRI